MATFAVMWQMRARSEPVSVMALATAAAAAIQLDAWLHRLQPLAAQVLIAAFRRCLRSPQQGAAQATRMVVLMMTD